MSSASAPRSGPAHLRWSGVVGVVVSLLLLWWVLHDVELAELWAQLREVRVAPFIATIVLATLSFPIRTIRWRYLLRLEGEPLPFVPLWHATAIGFMANNILPARAGEVARAYAARRLTGVRFSTAFVSIAVERVMDGIALVTILMVAIWAGGFASGTAIGSLTLGGVARGATVLFGALLAVALLLVHWPGPALGVARTIAGRVFPARWAAWIVETLEGALEGLDALRSPKQFAVITVWSFVLWIVAAGSYWTALHAFGLDVPWSAALLLQGLIAFGVAIPSSPGFFGPLEAVVKISLALYGVGSAAAVSYAIGYHIGTFIPITVLGLWSLSRAHLHLADLRAVRATDDVNGQDGGDGA